MPETRSTIARLFAARLFAGLRNPIRAHTVQLEVRCFHPDTIVAQGRVLGAPRKNDLGDERRQGGW